MRCEGLEKGDAESGVSPQSCDQTQSRRTPNMALHIQNNKGSSSGWFFNKLTITAHIVPSGMAYASRHGYVLTPGRYVGAADVEDDDTPFPERFAALRAKLEHQFAESDRLTATIRQRLAGVIADG